MESKLNFFEPLLASAEEYSKTSFDLLKLRSVDKAADISSTLISRLLLLVVILLFTLTLNTAIALWLGDLLGKIYYGFLIVASFYGLIGLILWLSHSFIKTRIGNSVINQILN